MNAHINHQTRWKCMGVWINPFYYVSFVIGKVFVTDYVQLIEATKPQISPIEIMFSYLFLAKGAQLTVTRSKDNWRDE